MPGPSSSTQSKDNRPVIRSVEALKDAPTAPDPEALLRERGEMVRRVGEMVLAQARLQARMLRERDA